MHLMESWHGVWAGGRGGCGVSSSPPPGAHGPTRVTCCLWMSWLHDLHSYKNTSPLQNHLHLTRFTSELGNEQTEERCLCFSYARGHQRSERSHLARSREVIVRLNQDSDPCPWTFFLKHFFPHLEDKIAIPISSRWYVIQSKLHL